MLTQKNKPIPHKFSFTITRIVKLPTPSKGQQLFWDKNTPGLGIRVTANGVKAYIFQGRLYGKTLRMTIGHTKVWSIKQARTETRRIGVLIDQGVDPRIEAIKLKEDFLAKNKLGEPALEAWHIYLEERKNNWTKRYFWEHQELSRNGGELITKGLRRNQNSVKEVGFLRPILDLPFESINQDVIAKWARNEMKSRPTKTHLALTMFKAFIKWASNHSSYKISVKENIFEKIRSELPARTAKTDCLQKEQLETWFAVVAKIPNTTIGTYLQCLLLSGARKEELASLTWDDVDPTWKTIKIRDKINKTRTIPLTPYLNLLITSLPKINSYVFSSERAKSGYIQEPRASHNSAIKKANLPHISIHGLRRSFGTLAEWVDCPIGISAQIMGHAPSAIAEKHYRQRPIDLLRKWHIRIEKFILEEAKIKFDSNFYS